MRQHSTPNVPSREEKLLEGIKAATKASDAAGDGVFDLELEDQTGVMGNVNWTFQDSLPEIQTLPPAELDSTPSRELPFHPGHPGQHGMFHKTPASGSRDWLCWDPPEEDLGTDEGKRSSFKPLSPFQESISNSLADAAHQMMKSNPQAVLKGVLEKMLHDPKRAWNLAPYMLAMTVRAYSALYKLAATDIEAAATQKCIQTWPHYAINAANGMRPVFVWEVGYSRCLLSGRHWSRQWLSVQAAENLTPEMKREATTGMSGSQKSLQFGAGRLRVNKKALEKMETDRTEMHSQPTAELARKFCMQELRNLIILTHSPSGFDERALLRIQLIELAELYEGPDCLAEPPEEAVWTAAKKLLDDSASEIPMFFKGFGPVRQVLDVLHTMLKDSDEHKELMEGAEQAGVKRLGGTLEQAFKVHVDRSNKFPIHADFSLSSLFAKKYSCLQFFFVSMHAQVAELAHLEQQRCFAGFLWTST